MACPKEQVPSCLSFPYIRLFFFCLKLPVSDTLVPTNPEFAWGGCAEYGLWFHVHHPCYSSPSHHHVLIFLCVFVVMRMWWDDHRIKIRRVLNPRPWRRGDALYHLSNHQVIGPLAIYSSLIILLSSFFPFSWPCIFFVFSRDWIESFFF